MWNEKVTFEIATGHDDLRVLVVSNDDFGAHNLIGKCTVPLDSLRDQMRHDEWYDLEPPEEGGDIPGCIELSLQWVFCKRLYFENALKRIQETYDQETQQK